MSKSLKRKYVTESSDEESNSTPTDDPDYINSDENSIYQNYPDENSVDNQDYPDENKIDRHGFLTDSKDNFTPPIGGVLFIC